MNRKTVTISLIFIAIASGFFIFSTNKTSLVGYSVLDEISPEEKELMSVSVDENYIYFENSTITYALDIDSTEYGVYGIKKANDEIEKDRIRWAMRIIENSTEGIVQFKEVGTYESPDIMVYGRSPSSSESEGRFRVEGFAGPTEVQGNRIIASEVMLYATKTVSFRQDSDFFVQDGWLWESTEYEPLETISWEAEACKNFPQTEIHEILHALGIGHVYDDSYSVMAPIKHKIQSCKVEKIDGNVASCLQYIYSNGELGNGCSDLNMYPWEEEQKSEDFVWDNLPVTYSIFDCNERQVSNIKKAEKVIEKHSAYDLYEFREGLKSQINFRCHDSFDDVLLNEDTDFWDMTVYFPSAQPYFKYEGGKIKEVEILLFAQNRSCGGIEMHQMLHGIGLVDHYGRWMEYETELCNTRVMVVGTEAIDKIKEVYEID